MRTEDAMTAEVVELLRTLIRNACVNDGTDASGHEIRSADTFEAYLSGVGLAMERYTAADYEANGTHGVGHLLDHHADAIRADYVITEAGGVPVPSREGPLLPVAVGEKGAGWRRLVVRGTAGHGALPFGADNALVTA